MAATDTQNIDSGVEKLNISNSSSAVVDVDTQFIEKYGFVLEEVYRIGLKFFKGGLLFRMIFEELSRGIVETQSVDLSSEPRADDLYTNFRIGKIRDILKDTKAYRDLVNAKKEGKALQLTYQTKLQLVALTKQATFGKYRVDISPDVGLLDVVGNDRKNAWQALGEMSKDTAMTEFVQKMADSCSLFEPYVEAQKREKEEALQKQKEEEERMKEEAEEEAKRQVEEQVRKAEEAEKQKQKEQELQIRSALNQQTTVQFRQYAEQQYPTNKDMQDELIKQLQDQHFQQYMQQVYQQQVLQQQQQQQQQQAAATPNGDVSTGTGNTAENGGALGAKGIPNGGDDEEVSIARVVNTVPASLWTRKDIKTFKDGLRSSKENVIRIGSLATATVRVPTHEDGTCLFWEFATDYYDIGFGVYFEWSIAQSNAVSVHVSESSDEEDLEEEEGKSEEGKADVEKGSGKKAENRPPTDEIIPVYRRDCHEEVYCGSHTYPGRGVYLLKFDNSYSLWRSKTLYYRVYYSR